MERVLVGKREAKKCQNTKNVFILLLDGLISRRNHVKVVQFNNILQFLRCAKIISATISPWDWSPIGIRLGIKHIIYQKLGNFM